MAKMNHNGWMIAGHAYFIHYKTENIKLKPNATGNTIKVIGIKYNKLVGFGQELKIANPRIRTKNWTTKFTVATAKLVKGRISLGNQTFFSNEALLVIETAPLLIDSDNKFQKSNQQI